MNPPLPYNAGWGESHVMLKDIVDRYDWEGAKGSTTIRGLLQGLGVAMREYVHDKVWINAALSNMDSNKRYVITDVRFPNEALAIKDIGGKIWRMHRPGTVPVNDHVSETAMNGFQFDKVFINDTSQGTYYGQIEDFLNDV